jgi:hypothetical protein
MCKNSSVVEHHFACRQRSAILHARLASDLSIRESDFQGFEMTCSCRKRASGITFSARLGQHRRPQDLPSFRHSHQWIGPLLWPHATRCSQSFPMRSRRRTARSRLRLRPGYKVRSSRSASRRKVSDAAAAEDQQAEHAVPEYAPPLVAFGRPPLAESVELRVKLDRVR